MLAVTIIQTGLLRSILMLGDFAQDAAQFNLRCCLNIKKQKLHLSFAL